MLAFVADSLCFFMVLLFELRVRWKIAGRQKTGVLYFISCQLHTRNSQAVNHGF